MASNNATELLDHFLSSKDPRLNTFIRYYCTWFTVSSTKTPGFYCLTAITTYLILALSASQETRRPQSPSSVLPVARRLAARGGRYTGGGLFPPTVQAAGSAWPLSPDARRLRCLSATPSKNQQSTRILLQRKSDWPGGKHSWLEYSPGLTRPPSYRSYVSAVGHTSAAASAYRIWGGGTLQTSRQPQARSISTMPAFVSRAWLILRRLVVGRSKLRHPCYLHALETAAGVGSQSNDLNRPGGHNAHDYGSFDRSCLRRGISY